MEDIIPESIVPAQETTEERIIRIELLNKKLFARAKTAEGYIPDGNGGWIKKPVVATAPVSEQAAAPKPGEILKSPEFRLHRQGYNEEEIELIMNNGGAAILENKTHPLVLGIEAARTQRSAEVAAAAVVDSTGASEVERKYTPDQLRAMPTSDLEKILPHVVK